MELEIVPFDESALDGAGRLLAGRHARHREAAPLLPARFERPEVAAEAIGAALRRPHAAGVAALDGERLVGYLVADLAIDAQRGRTAWVRLAGYAADPAYGVEPLRDLYAAASSRWVAAGCFDHYVMAPAGDRAGLDAWFSLSFGQEQVYALRPLTAADTHPGQAPEIAVRRAGPGDAGALSEASGWIARHLARPPCYGAAIPEIMEEVRQGYGELASDQEWTVWLALRDDQLLGFQGYVAATGSPDDLLTPEGAVELGIAATREDVRGQGIAALLTRRGLAEARGAGFSYCVTDWRTTNLLASRAWPRLGFAPAFYRLVRRVDPRIAWAHLG